MGKRGKQSTKTGGDALQGFINDKGALRYLKNLRVDSGVHIDEITTPKRVLTDSIKRASHIKLSPEEWQLAFNKLQTK